MVLPNWRVCQWEGCDHLPPSLPDCIPSAPQRRHAPSRQTPGNHHGQESSWVPSSKVASPHVWHATLTRPIGARERALDLWVLTLVGVVGCLPLQCWLGWFILPRSSWRWDSSGGGHSRSSTPSTRMVWVSSLGLNQLASSLSTSSVYHIGGGNQWASLTLAPHSRPFSVSEGALPSAKVTWHFCQVGLGDWINPWMVPLQWEVTWGPSAMALGSTQQEVTWGSPFWHPKDLDLLCQSVRSCWSIGIW